MERIREGYYSDAYFNFTKELLEAEERHPRVLMQVFQRKDSILGGIDEAIAVLKHGAGHDGATLGQRLGAPRGPGAARGRRDLAVGDRDDDRGRLLAVRPPRDRLPRLMARRTLMMRNVREVVDAARGKPILYFPARHDHWLVQTGDGWAAHIGGSIGVSTDAQASWWGGRGVGTVPHGLIAAYGGDTALAARKFADRFGGDMNVTVLVDFDNDSVRTALAVAEALGDELWGVRLDTSRQARRRVAAPPARRRRAQGRRRRSSSSSSAPSSTRHGYKHVHIVVSGGFNAERIRSFEAAGVPVDSYGVGSSLIRGANDFTADVVMMDGRPRAKVGRELRPNPRLEPVARSSPRAGRSGRVRGRGARRPSRVRSTTTSRWSPSSTGTTSRPPGASCSSSAAGSRRRPRRRR